MIEIFLLIIAIAFICEWIDAGLGMGYGTILSPILIMMGFSPLISVPSILITQAIGGLSASFYHHRHGNVCFSIKSTNPVLIFKKIKEYGPVNAFKRGFSEDLKIVFFITSLGIIATIFAALVAGNIPKNILSMYIAIIVLIMGLLIGFGFTFTYSTAKMFIVGIVSAFNKGISGGGFGPLVTGGQVTLEQDHKKAIGCTTGAEFPICIAGFITYLIIKGFPGWELILPLGTGALFGGIIGPLTTKKINRKALKVIVALLLIVLGTLTLLKIKGLITLNISF
ncbi:MAG: sulfite exporter TauE/SafE family protein [Nanoarchaeota archaeon]